MSKRSLILLILVIAAIAWYNNRGPGAEILERAIERLRSVYRVAQLLAQPPDTAIVVPVAGVPVGEIADTWGAPRGSRQHQGQDIFAPKGTPVLSAADGVVVRIAETSLGGRTVSVLGRGRRTFYYAHLDAYAPGLEVGDEVAQGGTLGYVGNTGNARSTPPHLHFGIYGAGVALNPLPLLIDPPPAPDLTVD